MNHRGYIYEFDRLTGKQYRKYLGSGARVEVEAHSGHLDEEKVTQMLYRVLINKIEQNSEYRAKIECDAQMIYDRYSLCHALSDYVWKTTPTLKKANYKWWKLWLLPIFFGKNKEIKNALEKINNNKMPLEEALTWLEVSNIQWSTPSISQMPAKELLEWASKDGDRRKE